MLSLGPLDSFQALRRLAPLGDVVLLDSALRHPGLGRFSFLTAGSHPLFEIRQGTAFWRGTPVAGPPLPALRRILALGKPAEAAGLPFRGGALGFLTYEAGRLFERQPVFAETLPQARFVLPDWLIVFDHGRDEAFLLTGLMPWAPAGRAARLRSLLDAPAPPLPDALGLEWRAEWRPAEFKAAVERVIAAILAGDLFQANIAQGFTADLPEGFDDLALYDRLRRFNPGDFAAFLRFGDVAIASSSPERFFRVAGGRVEARPIKGTIAATGDAAADAARLAGSAKDRAENVMIVDLLRNDLSRVCRPHSVQVPELCAIEAYAGLSHMVSTVTGMLRPGLDALDLLAAAFPGGSITGAPKPKAMELIGAIEGRARGIYCGSIGYLGFDGTADFSIAIRTLTLAGGKARFEVGGGITALSDPAAEYRETMVKAARIFAATGGMAP